jgi:choline dehydrogenase-like flavoprotein
MRRMAELVSAQFSRTGIEPPNFDEWVRNGETFPTSFQDIAHPTGTTRMADDPTECVVDRDCQVHVVHGLYVAGSSVFPTSGRHCNPTQMIVALALRLADTLKLRFASQASNFAQPSSWSETATSTHARTRVLVSGASDGKPPISNLHS